MTTLLLYLIIQFGTPSSGDKTTIVTGEEPQPTMQTATSSDSKEDWIDE